VKAEVQTNAMAARGIIATLQVVIVAVLVVVAYRDVLPFLVLEWYEHENFSYGFLIPVIFGYLVWDGRDALKSITKEWSPWGILSIGLALLMGIVGQVMGEPFVSRVSFVWVIGSLVHLFWGWPTVRCLAFPLAYLFLMVPPPYPIVKAVSYHLKMVDASVAEVLLRLVGVPIYRDAYFLHLPNITLEVADICSGIASLFAMVALGILYAHYLPITRAAKLAVFVSALILPILANLFRILLVGVSVYHYGPVMLRAFFHSFTGTFTFLLSLAMLLGFGEWLRRRYGSIPQRGAHRLEGVQWAARDRRVDGQKLGSWFSSSFCSAVIILALTLLISGWSHGPVREGRLPDLTLISPRLGAYEARDGNGEGAYRDPYAEAAVSRLYQASRNEAIELFVGYRSRQFGVERLRSPKLVFPEGWEYASMGGVKIPLAGGQTIDSIWLETRSGNARKLVVFWYQVRGLSFASDIGNRIELFRGLLSEGRTDGAVVRLASPVSDTETLEQAKRRLLEFSSSLHPELIRFLPN
jgi:EpsI family protein